MTRAGQIIENPVTGERLVFRTAGAPTAVDVFRADVFARPYGPVAAAHIHSVQEEKLTIVSGRVRVRIGRDEQSLAAHQTVSIPAGARHMWWNDGDSDAQLTLELRPGRGAETLFDALFALARERKTDEHGTPGALDLAILADEHGYYRAGVPIRIQRAILPPLAVVARALGRGSAAASR